MIDVAWPSRPDPELDAVIDELYRLDPTGDRVAVVLRDTFDQLYDGQRTGRWNFNDLHKTEKTHMGTLVEINLHREFDFDDGDTTDYRIVGFQVDCKYSMKAFGWMLPPEVIDQVALLLTANDEASTWRAGVVRVVPDATRPAQNRDGKTSLSVFGRQAIRWLWPDHPGLAPNLFYQLDSATRDSIFNARSRSGRHGQARVNELFRRVHGQIVRRSELATVAQQDDFMKRARGNGGARTALRSEGILVLGHQENDPLVAGALGLPVPRKGEFVAARVIPASPGRTNPAAEIGGELWVVARPGDPVVSAPEVGRGCRIASKPSAII
ncbi:NaeI family type II restriction endonuclease [Mycolicibacter heraklionensis]|uniref:NaeI family type II restriction endonuclease n=1 Tax=Mycolicibacter heraklionensis TaxID=512402 RepID=A0A9X7WHN3_9MYCO|nr:NaeI family type II restriction endonuclease [Mycolicibacter heraklionensis]QZA08393.1 NaeI family type II restriction endonuclease [Mycolicibacter heraklionensis]